jgi:hypothetical protein
MMPTVGCIALNHLLDLKAVAIRGLTLREGKFKKGSSEPFDNHLSGYYRQEYDQQYLGSIWSSR